jgi:putative transposase
VADAMIRADPKDILGEHGLLRQLTKRVVERALAAELTTHLGYEPHVRNGSSPGDRRNGKGKKRVDFETEGFLAPFHWREDV